MQTRDNFPDGWMYLSDQLVDQLGEKYFEDFIVFRYRIYHYFIGEIDINNYDLYQEARLFLHGERIETILAELRKDPSRYTLSPPKA